MKLINLEIVTPAKKAFTGMVKSVTVPGTLGSFQVLFNHAPLISNFEIGKIKIVDENGTEKYFATSGGLIEVLNNKVIILADSFESPADILIDRATEAMNRAKERLKVKQNIDMTRAEAALARAINRISVYSKYKSTTQ